MLLALAIWRYIVGDSDTAAKLLLFAGLPPGIILFGMWAWWVIHRPRWYLRPQRVIEAAVLVGMILLLLPLLAYLPWMPSGGIAVDDIPFGLPLVMAAGAALAVLGMAGGFVLSAREAARRGDWARMAVIVALLGAMASGIVYALANRP